MARFEHLLEEDRSGREGLAPRCRTSMNYFNMISVGKYFDTDRAGNLQLGRASRVRSAAQCDPYGHDPTGQIENIITGLPK